MPELGVNAIAAAAALIGELDRIGTDIAARQNDPRFEPPYSTVSVGTIKGGTAHNIVPKTCEFRWQVRSLPQARARRGAATSSTPSPRLRCCRVCGRWPTMPHRDRALKDRSRPSSRRADSEAVALALALTGAEQTHAVSYATEAGLFEQAGCPAVICGPGDIAQAHAADEYVSLAQLDACMAFLEGLADRLSAYA